MNHDTSKRWDLLLAIKSPSDKDCLAAFATVEGVEALAGYPNIVARAAKEFAQLPELLERLPSEFVAVGVRNVFSGEVMPSVSLGDDINHLFE